MVAYNSKITRSILGALLMLASPCPFAADVVGTLIQTIITKSSTGGWGSITSPDPSGLAYLDHTGRLLDCDGEVDEMPAFFTGDNLFEINLDGTLGPTHSTTNLSRSGYSNEPVGCAYNPANRNLFISDDDQRLVFQIRPGADNQLFTGDDIRTQFRAPDVCNVSDIDAEGLAFGAGKIFIIDGVGAEVWQVTPSADGIFDGVGESCTHFDTSGWATDPEGGEYDTENPGHLFVVGKPKTRIVSFTTAGTQAGTIDISSTNTYKPAGLATAPGSRGSSDPTPGCKNLYIADRGVDNNTTSTENDGKIYELSIPCSTPGTNQAPTVNAGLDQPAVSFSAACANQSLPTPCINLDGTVTDDGLPNPPGSVSTVWSKISGPGTIHFGNPNAVDTTADFSVEGSYVLRLTANDGALSNSDDVQINILPPPPPLDFTKLYVSTVSDGTTADTVAYANEDILAYDTGTGTWSLYFDGSDVGLGGSADIDAFSIRPDGSILLSLTTDGVTIPGLGAIDNSDIVRFIPTSIGSTTAGSYEWYFDGSDVELTSSSEDIDAIGFLPDGRLVISTTGSPTVTGASGAADEDLLVFTPTELGATTSGTWDLYFDGSDVELSTSSDEDVNGVFIDNNADIYLTTLGAFSVTGASGSGADIFTCVPITTGSTTACSYNFTWGGISNGLPSGAVLDGITLVRDPSGNTAPTITITSPANNASFAEGAPITFTGTATDIQNGSLTSSLSWTSSLNGGVPTNIGTGGNFTLTTLPAGIHLITATATDIDGLSGSASVTISISAPGGSTEVVDVRVSSSSDDAEEHVDGTMESLGSSDLELTLESDNQTVGMRFNGITIPQGATIQNAYIQFQADEAFSTATTLQITGQAADNAATFTNSAGNISSRPTTAGSVAPVSWTPAGWPTVGAAGIDQRTPDIKSVIQAIVNRAGWTSGNSLVVIITGDGNGKRVAESFDGAPAGAPLLHVEYSTNAQNNAPTVNAGIDQAIALPNTATLDGTVNDDDLPNPPAAVTTLWTQISGPGTTTFADPTAVDTTASFSVDGIYVLRLTADDSVLSSFDEITVTVSPGNLAPTVNAGIDQAIALPNTAALDGTVNDDGLPNPPATVTTLWTQISGPGTTTFADPTAVDTTASFSVDGTYVLRLTADDSALSSFDEITVTVSSGNLAPTVNAGIDQAIALPNTAALDGTVNDDGLPNPPVAVTTLWTQISGPGTTTFADPTAVDTTASFSVDGTYVLRLTADDSVLFSFDEITVTVSPGNLAPTVNAGIDQAIALPNNATLDGTVNDDGLPNPPAAVTTLWTQISGPGTTTFADPTAVDTTASFSVDGIYVLRLTADDSVLSSFDEITVTVSPAGSNLAPVVDAGPDLTTSLSQGTSTPGLPGSIDGIMPEAHGHIGPFVDNNGNLYTIVEDFLANGNEPRAMKSSDGGATWNEIDAAGRSTTGDLEGDWAVQVGTTIYFAFQKSSGAIYLTAFNTSDASVTPDKWVIQQQLIHDPSTAPDNQYVSLASLSNGDLWAFYATEPSGGNQQVGYRKRSSSTGTWSAQFILDSGLNIGQVVAVTGTNDKVHVFYKDHTNNHIYHRSLTSAGTLSAAVQVDSTQVNSIHSPMTNPVYYDAAGTERIVVAWADASGILKATSIDNDGAPSVEQTVSAVPVTINPGITTNLGGVAHLAVDGTTVHALYADAATQDIWHDMNTNGSGWGVDEETDDGLTTQWITGLSVYNNVGGQHVLAYIYDTGPHADDGGIIRYNELALAGVTQINGSVTDDGLPNPPGTTTSQWSTVSGPGIVTFANPASPVTTATFSETGTYVLRLTADDSALSSFDEITVTVSPGNLAPTVNAGIDQAISLPNNASLDGTVNDDGLPNPPVAVTTLWTQISGPGTTTFADPTAVDTTASFSVDGIYVLRLTADDSVLSSFDEITVTVSPGNLAPTVNAGIDQAISLPNTAALDGTVNDDGLPNPPATVTTLWTQISGPGTTTFADPTAVDTTASFSVDGTYVLRLTADDSALSSFDEITVTVSSGNLAPTVNAGIDQAIALPNNATLDGTVNDDGLPNPPAAVTTLWTQISGPGTTTFADPTAVDTTASFSVGGTYVLRLTADDSALSSFDDVTVNVSDETTSIDIRISSDSDDAEEHVDGTMESLGSSDLELTLESDNQTVGMRFNGITIPQGATILNATIQFQVDEASSTTTTLQITGQAADNAATFTNSAGNISSRPTTAGSVAPVSWTPAGWPTVGAAGTDQRTPDIKSVIQAIVSRAGWTSGNSLVVIITGDGNGKRVAESFDGVPSAAPLLHIEYSATPPTLPSITISSPANNSHFTEGAVVNFLATASDPQDGDITASLQWSVDGTSSGVTGGSFSTSTLTAGTHTVIASVTDNDSNPGTASVTVVIDPVPTLPTVSITSPADGAHFTEGATVNFLASASDPQDGDITASLVWSVDGTLSGITGGSFSTSTLTVGTHTVTASVTDNDSNPGTASITVVIDPVGVGPIPAHQWQFDDNTGTTAVDSAGTNNATLSNITWVDGKTGTLFDKAVSFNGTNSVGDAGQIDFGTGNFTVVHWVKVTSFNNFAGIFNNRSSASGNIGFHTRTDSTGTLKALIDFGASSRNVAITNAAPGIWYHVAVAVDRAGFMKLYVNGVLSGQVDISAFNATSLTNPDNVRLGRDQASNYFNGVMDDLRIYNSALSEAEILKLYNE